MTLTGWRPLGIKGTRNLSSELDILATLVDAYEEKRRELGGQELGGHDTYF